MYKILHKSILLITFFAYQAAVGQEKAVQLETPRQTVITHLIFLQDESFEPKKSAQTLLPGVVPETEAEQMAIKLKQIYDGSGLYIDVEEIPNQRNYFDSVSSKNHYIINSRFPEIYLVLQNGKWYYSRRTIEQIDKIHKRIYPFGVDKLLNILPKIGNQQYFGLYLWQHITLLLIIIIATIFYKTFTFLFNRLLLYFIQKKGYEELARKFVSPVGKPLSLLVVFMILMILVPVLQLPIKVNQYIIYALRASLPLFATLVAYKSVDILAAYLEKLASRTENKMDDQLVPLARKVLKIFVVIVGGLFVLNNLDYNITALLAGLSIGGLAVALAAQDTLKNFFGSVMIFLDKPFKIGDWVTMGSVDGTVEEVGFRATRIRTFRNSLVYVPNAKIADGSIDNHGERKHRRFFTTITITYDTPPEKVEAFVDGLRIIVANHPKTWKDNYHIYFNDLGSHSLDIMFYVFFSVPTWGEELQCKHEILLDILRLAEELDVRFAFPTQTLHVEEFPGKESLTPMHTIGNEELKQKVSAYFEKQKTSK